MGTMQKRPQKKAEGTGAGKREMEIFEREWLPAKTPLRQRDLPHNLIAFE
jgi:hypothetical protein